MSRISKNFDRLPAMLDAYAQERGVEFHRYSKYHMRIIYDPQATVDIWTTGKYWVKETNYFHGITERGGEKGWVPFKQKHLYAWLDTLLFIVEIREEKQNAQPGA